MAGHRELLFFLLVVSLSSCDWGQPCSGWFQNIRNGHCYMKFCDGKSFDAAQRVCEKYEAHLPYIRNEQEDKFVATLSRSVRKKIKWRGREYMQNHWIGIKLLDGPGGKKWRFVNGTEATYFNWQPIEPNNLGGNEECVHYAPVWGDWFRWNDLKCEHEQSDFVTYICEKDSCVDLK
ncbi:unnamed protein product [Cylicocyclus nassatus]|uniref:C-type lectin domain-containing protein n=1 Tax=Cylicocyclus nassatus TaxID=53992 RepID=A0AA36GN88_CYLNA|nr:unnamed protein product [Cylicocyclus nassatus]